MIICRDGDHWCTERGSWLGAHSSCAPNIGMVVCKWQSDPKCPYPKCVRSVWKELCDMVIVDVGHDRDEFNRLLLKMFGDQ